MMYWRSHRLGIFYDPLTHGQFFVRLQTDDERTDRTDPAGQFAGEPGRRDIGPGKAAHDFRARFRRLAGYRYGFRAILR